MADGALAPAIVDVPVGSLNQRPPDHAGPTGRLTNLYDVEIVNYAAGGEGKRLLLDPRKAFASLSNTLRNSLSGLTESGVWSSPTFLRELGDQLLSICTDQPRVYNGTDWTNYGTRRVVTQKLSESVMHATNATIAAPDSAWLTGVTCSVWTEQAFSSAGVLDTSLMIGFRADDGAWVTVPQKYYTALGSSNEYVMARVVQDGTNFWVFYNIESSGAKIFIDCYDLHGVRLASSSTTRFWTTSPGYWDVYGSVLAGVLLAQPAAFNATPTDVGFNVKKFTQSGGVISNPINSTLTGGSNHCMGPLAWLTNDLTGTKVYLGTVNISNRLWAYELDNTLAVTKVYDVNISPALLPENLTGWVLDNAGNRDVFLSYSQLAGPAATTGPTFDPAKRFIRTISRTFAGVTSTVRTTQSVLQQSRAFAINGEYYAYTYYASGSGKKLPTAIQSVVVEETDSFYGDTVQPLTFTGGGTYGAPFNPPLAAAALTPTGSMVPKNIDGGGTADKVVAIAASGLSAFGVPDGTPVLQWTFKNALMPVFVSGAILKVNSSSIPSANFNWDILIGSGTIAYTSITNRVGGAVIPGNFTTTGTVEVLATLPYRIASLGSHVASNAASLFDNGTVTVSGASSGGNNGTFSILPGRTIVSTDPTQGTFGLGAAIWVLVTTQVNENPTSATIVVSANNPNAWFFAGGEKFTDVDQASTLNVSGTGHAAPTGDGNFAASNTNDDNTIETGGADATSVMPQIFPTSPLPTVTLTLDDASNAFTLNLGNVFFDYTYMGALVSIANTRHAITNGVYTITEIIDPHTVRLIAAVGAKGQRSETFSLAPASPTVTIQRATDVQPQTQPTWFVTPLTGSQPQVGMFEKGLAFADWRFDGETAATVDFNTQDRFRFALSSTSNPFGTIRQVVLPFRVTNFTQVSIATVGATAIDIANVAEASTVGLKVFRSQGAGQGTGDAGKLLVPGLLATEFTLSGFAESNFNIGPEAPFIVSEGNDAGTNFGLTPGKTYTYQAVIARTIENGDVVRSLPSPPIQVTLTGPNNFVVLGGRLVVPLDTAGAAVSKTFGLTNHPKVTYEIYRSVIIDGVPSTQLHLVTDPANSNGMYTSGTGSGFTFPDTYTWNFRDELPDAGASATEVIYAGTLGQGIAPHFPAPAFTHAATWNNRRWVVGYDGAVWMSAELVEGEAPWFFPGFRYPFPPEDPAVCVVGFENYLFMLCAKSIYRIGTVELPNATLTAGSMPTPVKLPIAMGCSGFAQACTDFVAYSSSADSRQVWAITRDLANVYLSEPLSQFNNAVSGMTVDGQQRLLVAAADTQLRVFDPVAREWYVWKLTTSTDVLAVYQGKPTFEDSGFVNQQTASGIVDTRNAVTTPVPIDVTFSSLSFAQVRAVKRLWEAHIIGKNNGACNINAIIGYPDDDPSSTTVFGPTLLAASPLLLAINPEIEDATSFDVRIFGSYGGIGSPGRCFSLEMLSCEVGLDRKQGLRKLPDGFRLVGT